MSSGNIKIRIPYAGTVSAMGPGKADLVEAIDRCGSISGAARDMGMSYKRAWDLVDTMNKCFREPLVVTATGGSRGGGAQVTAFGHLVVRRYRELVAKANHSVAAELDELMGMLAPTAQE